MRYLAVTRTLVYYDGPQLLLGHDGRGTPYLAVALPHSADSEAPFLAVAVSQNRLDDYFAETIDLRSVFRRPKGDRYFSFSLEIHRAGRYPLTDCPSVKDDWLPSAGFFASQHTEIQRPVDSDETYILDIPIDGRWDLNDLAKFPNKYVDAYAFLFAVRCSTSEIDADHISGLFHRYPWRGGYSSVRFYDDLYRTIPRPQRITVREIRYASPGLIRIEANQDLTDQLRALVMRLNENWRDIKSSAQELQNAMSERGFLGTSNYEVEVSSADREFLAQSCANLATAMQFQGLSVVNSLCGRNWVATAKIFLSFYRRLFDLSDFFETGKASLR